MTRPGIEHRSPCSLANTLPTTHPFHNIYIYDDVECLSKQLSSCTCAKIYFVVIKYFLFQFSIIWYKTIIIHFIFSLSELLSKKRRIPHHWKEPFQKLIGTMIGTKDHFLVYHIMYQSHKQRLTSIFQWMYQDTLLAAVHLHSKVFELTNKV